VSKTISVIFFYIIYNIYINELL